ncbi:MAG TPA: 16S rRNA (cytidine(1402)-2'-O)-methyltransferase [Candidatus Dojkabacteria bacterium]|nr:16S rRNA (cytidine(1402)-2'-O)-methyltransferase [Candidatus Dojkabacteria bacterium]
MKGKLYIVATPIGNLEDISFRAISMLKNVTFVLAEDTRQTLKLFNRYEIKTHLVSYRDQNHDRIMPKVLEKLDMGLDLAIVSDSGTPNISDPGFKLVRDLKEKDYEVIPIPGASAVISALSASGLNTDKFTFLGFLPKGDGKRITTLEAFKDIPTTLVIYESPNRLKSLLEEIEKVFGDRKISIANDITKLYEKIETGNLSDLKEKYSGDLKGEFVVLIEKH